MHLALDPVPFRETPRAVSEAGQYCPASYWLETVSVQPRPELDRDIQCDVVVVGGGLTGLSIACELKKSAPTLTVVLLERAVAGHGASGRSAGVVTPLIGWNLADVAKRLGERKAAEACGFMRDAVSHFKRTIHRYNIACELEETGHLLLATSATRSKSMQRDVQLAERLGLELEYVEGSVLHDHIASEAFVAGAYDPLSAMVNPAKLVRGLLDVATNLGVQVFEQTPLSELDDGDPVTLTTPRGSIKAKQVVLAVNGYGNALGFMESQIYPVHSFVVLTEPLSENELAATGWAEKRANMETARSSSHYFRLTADHRILFGGGEGRVFFTGDYVDSCASTFARLEARFRKYFPELKHVKVTHRWGGVCGVTTDMFPTFGVGGDNGTVYHACGYSGRGIALSVYAGAILAPHILNRAGLADPGAENIEPFFWNRRPKAVPGKVMRFAGFHARRIASRARDWRDGG